MIWPFNTGKRKLSEPQFTVELLCEDCDARHAFSNVNFSRLVAKSCRDMDDKMSALRNEFGIGNGSGNWNYDEDKGELEFTFPDGRVCACPLEYIGSWFEPRQEYLWAWGNEHLPPARTTVAQTACAYGRKNDYRPLTSNRVWVSLEDAWHLAKTATSLHKVEGVYGAPVSDTLRVFFAITTPAWRSA